MSLYFPSPKVALFSAIAISSAAVVGVAAASSTAPAAHRAIAAAPARPAISHGFKPAVSPQGYDCSTGTSSPYFCLGGENDSAQSGFTYGVYGVEGYAPNSTGGVGVLGYSGNSTVKNAYGVYGVTLSPQGIGVYGAGDGPAPTANSTPSSTTESTGVVGDSHSGDGVFGSTEFPYGSDVVKSPVAGVYGVDATTNGTDNNGVYGLTLNGGFGVAGVSSGNSTKTATGGVLGAATTGFGVVGSSTSSYGVYGQGTGTGASNYGVYGISQTTDGIVGTASALGTYGVGGVGTGSANGVGGSTTSAAGYAMAANNAATSGTATGAGLLAESSLTPALIASTISTSEPAAVITSTGTGTGGALGAAISAKTYGATLTTTTAGGYGLDISTPGTTATYPIEVNSTYVGGNSVSGLVFYVGGTGDVYYAGTLNNEARTRNGYTAHTFTARQSMQTIEDVGSAQLVNGTSAVRLDPALIEQMDHSSAYHVFVTPDGDTHGLFVASRTPAGFTVRENEGGRSTTAFEYRIVATVDGHAGERMSLSRAPQSAIPSPPRNEALSAPRHVTIAIASSKAATAFAAKMRQDYRTPLLPAALFHPQRNALIESRGR